MLDPHGDLIDRICGIIPSARIEDVVLVDPSDEQYSVGFNILSAHSELEKTLLASDLVAVFQRLSTSWGDQMNSVLQNAILAFLESDRRGNIADLRRFLIEPVFRSEFLKSVNDSEVVYYWQKSFPHLSGNKSIGSILTRLDTFLAKKPIRYMVSQSENRLDFAQIMDTGKIFLAKLPEGLLGRENSYLLGALLVSKFQQLVMSRQAQQITARRDFWLYIDEFANFITPSMAEILSGARKYRIGLTLAHHELQQLQRNSEVASAVISHPFTRIVFRVGDEDAKKLAEGFSFFEAKDLRNLEVGQAICRVERSDYDFNLRVPLSPEPDTTAAEARRQQVITVSRKKHGAARTEVEAMLAKSRTPPLELPASPPEYGKPKPRTPTSTSAPLISEPPEVAETPKTSEIPKPLVAAGAEPATSVDTDATDDQHTAIKEKIGAEAETLDYTVSYEEHFPPIQARADIVLRRGKQFVVGQVTVRTPTAYEADSVRKLLKASFTHIAVISTDRKKLNLIRQNLAASGNKTEMVGFYAPEEFMSKLSGWALDDPEGGIAERKNPRRNRAVNLISGLLTKVEQEKNEKIMLDELRQKLKRKCM